MPRGGRAVLRTDASATTDRVRLEVQDTGVGIPHAHLKDIFNPFYTTKAPGQGTGLGLFVVHSILQRYGGDDPGGERARRAARRSPSSCPARATATLAASSDADRHERAHPPRRGRGQHGAHAGEEPRARRPYASSTRRTARPRSRVLANESFDVVADRSQDAGAWTAWSSCARCTSAASRRRSIVLTGYGTIESAVEAMKLGAADYLIKDARPQEILLTIERVAEAAGARARERAPARRDRPLRRASASSIGTSARDAGGLPA